MPQEDHWVGDWVLFSYDVQAGVERWYNPREDVFKTISHVDELVKQNKDAQANTSGKRWGSGQSVASIPLDVYYRELDQAVQQDDKKYMARWLNNSDNRAWRTKEGSI